MKTSLGLVLSALLVSAVFGAMAPRQPIKMMPGQSYVYQYSGRLVSGIAQLDSNAAVLEIKSDIVLQPEQDGRVAMQMTNILVGKHNGPVSEQLTGRIVIDHQPQQQYEQELGRPIRFVWHQNGQVKSFEAEQNEPEWSINIKKAVLSLLNVQLTPTQVIQQQQGKVNTIYRTTPDRLVVYPIYEDGVNGICETLYQVTSSEDAWSQDEQTRVLNVTKTRNYANCLTMPTIEKTNIDVRGAPVMCRAGKTFPAVEGYYPMGETESQLGGCPYGQAPKDSPVNSYGYTKYNISMTREGFHQIEQIYSEGKTVYETKGKQIMAISQQNMTLVYVLPTSQVGNVKSIKSAFVHQELSYRLPKVEESQKLEIPYYHLFGKINKEELKDLIPELLESVAADIAAGDVAPESQKTMQKVVQLSNAVAVLDARQLEQIFEQVAQAGRSTRATAQQQIVRKLWLDLIGSAGTSQAAILAKKLYEQDLITTHEAKEIFEAIPQNLFLVDVKVVEEYLNLFLSEKVQQQRHLASSLGITLGKLINEATEKQQQRPGDLHDVESVQKQTRAQAQINDNMIPMMAPVSRIRRSAPWEEHFKHELIEKEQVAQVMQVLQKALHEAPSFHQKVTLIEAIAHTGMAEALRILAPYVNDQAPVEVLPGYPVEDEETIPEERNFVRQVAIYALSHIARHHPQQVLTILLPIYQNQYEPYELRIAAFTVMIHCDPGRQVLEQITSQLHRENTRQLQSFVISALKTVANATEPSLKKVAEDAQFALGLAPKVDLGLQYSKMLGKGFYDEQKKHGMSMITEWVASNVSQIPRSGYFAIRQTDGPFHDVLLELGYNAKGVDSLIKRLVEPNGIVSDAFEAYNGKSKDRRLNRRNVDSAQQALQALKEKLNLAVRSEDEPKATVFFKLFERTSYYAFDRQYLHQMIDSAEDSIKDIVSQLVKGKAYHYVKLVMPKQLYRMVPSELGLPVIITERHPTILSVKIDQAKLELDQSSKAPLPSGANLTVQMQPSLLHTTYQFVFALTPATQETVGTQIEKTTRLTVPLEVSLGYQRAKNQISWSVAPKVPLEVLHHHTEAKTFISKASIAGSPQRDWLEDAVEIKTKQTPFQYEKQYLKQALGLGVRVHVTTENSRFSEPWYKSQTAQTKGLWAALIELAANDQITPCKVHMTLESESEQQVTGYDFALRYKKIEQQQQDETENETEDDDEETYEETQIRGNRQQQIWTRNSQMAQKWQQEQKKFSKKSIKHATRQLMHETKPIWKSQYEEQQQNEEQLPAIVAHNVLFTIVARSPRPTFYAANALLVKSYDQRAYWLKVNALKQSEQVEETKKAQLCLESIVTYPPMPSEFYYEPIANQAQKAQIKAKIAFGQDCQTGAKVEIDGVMEKTAEKVIRRKDLATEEGSQREEESQDWFYQQCKIDRAAGQPMSYACERAMVENAYFNQMVVDVHYEQDKIPAKLANLTQKLALAAKVALYSHLEENQVDVHNEQGKIRVTAQFSNRFADIPMANIYVQAPKEQVHFEKIHVPFFRPVSSLLSTVQVYKNLLTGYTHTTKCALMEDYVRTFDNVTVQLTGSPCQYLVAKDCSASEKFAVFARQLDQESKTKAVTVMIAGSEIQLMPATSAQQQQVIVDGKPVELNTASKAQYQAHNQELKVYVRKTASEATSPIVVVAHQKEDIKVTYDGKNVKVTVGAQYKGQTCGICGDNNDEAREEFTGPDACLYREAEDFVNSYALAGQHCERAPVAQGQKNCPKKQELKYQAKNYGPLARFIGQMTDLKEAKKQRRVGYMDAQANREEFARLHQSQVERQMTRQPAGQPMSEMQRLGAYGATAQQQQLMQRMRTASIRTADNQICFSVQPVLSCVQGVSRPVQLRQEVVGFHCLPAHSISAQRLAEQAQYQVLEIFGKKSVDLTSAIQIPVACQAA